MGSSPRIFLNPETVSIPRDSEDVFSSGIPPAIILEGSWHYVTSTCCIFCPLRGFSHFLPIPLATHCFPTKLSFFLHCSLLLWCVFRDHCIFSSVQNPLAYIDTHTCSCAFPPRGALGVTIHTPFHRFPVYYGNMYLVLGVFCVLVNILFHHYSLY